jgi:hypothetical protein
MTGHTKTVAWAHVIQDLEISTKDKPLFFRREVYRVADGMLTPHLEDAHRYRDEAAADAAADAIARASAFESSARLMPLAIKVTTVTTIEIEE